LTWPSYRLGWLRGSSAMFFLMPPFCTFNHSSEILSASSSSHWGWAASRAAYCFDALSRWCQYQRKSIQRLHSSVWRKCSLQCSSARSHRSVQLSANSGSRLA
jgi:hypothetical protein